MRKIKIIPLALLILLLCACARQTQDVVLFDPMSTFDTVVQAQAADTSAPIHATTQYTTEVTEPSTVAETTAPHTQPTQAPTKPTQPPETKPQTAEDPKPVEDDYNSAAGNTVWIPTKGGKKYHTKSTCSGMNGPEEVTKAEAERRGFTPCKKCYK